MSQSELEKISDFGLRIADSNTTDNPQSRVPSGCRNPQSPSARTLVALATYNEIENLPSLVDEILRVLPDADILVIDDNSPDGTGQWCDNRAAVEPRLHCLHRPGKQGLGSATLAAARFAMEHDYEAFVTLDADWSHDPRHVTELLRALDNADVAIGSRYCSGGGIEGWPIHRRVMSRWVNGLTRLLLRIPVRDASGAFRAYRVAKLREIRLEDIRATGYAYLEELLWHLHRAGAKFAEVPITFCDRRAGESKVNLREAWGKVGTLGRLWLRP
ncbi:MAG: polyprenol monophosphomannose synthase [Planctomycetes bacterium]|nr:polyprenol monophosphomannose synthase [Planctomycetota bacterium]